MTTFPDDFLTFKTFLFGMARISLIRLGLEWPPPELLYIKASGSMVPIQEIELELMNQRDLSSVLRRISMSQITDEQREDMSHVARGALYEYIKKEEGHESNSLLA